MISSATTINPGFRVDIDLRAIAFKDGMTNSEENEASYVWGGGDGINAQNSASRIVTYAYTPDKLNRSTMSDNGAVTTYATNAFNQYKTTSVNTFGYDNNFNLTHATGYNGIFDAANRLVSASNDNSGFAQLVAEFVYDGLGRCVKRTFNGVATILIYDGWKPIAEFDEWGTFQAWNVYGPGPDEILLRQRGEDGYIRFGLDRHGNVAFLFDNDGVLLEKYTYDVFGRPTITGRRGETWQTRDTSHYAHSFFFQGREYIPEIGIYDYRNRFYHPGLGRFLQTDPVGVQTQGEKLTAGQNALFSLGGQAPETFSSSELNLYRYCGDDPVDLSDPMGLMWGPFNPTFHDIVDTFHVILDAVGTVEPTPFSDLANAAIYGFQGDRINAAISVAGVLPYLGDAGKIAKYGAKVGHWGKQRTLARHFRDHGADFAAKDAADYAKKASDFLKQSQANKLPTKIGPDGTIRVYDPKSNTFGSYNPDGSTKTFYKPDPKEHGLPTNADYWKSQPGKER